MIKADKNVPLPKSPAQAKYPWHTMEVGDSFFVPGRGTNGNKHGLRPFSATNGKTVIHGSEWAVRDVAENGVRGVRVWRVK